MDFYLTALLQGLCFAGLAFGIYLSMKIFNIPDITSDGSYTLGGITAAVLATHHCPAWLVVPIVLLAGGAAGMITGLIHTQLKINALLAGILTMTGLYSVNLIIAGRSNVPLPDDAALFSRLSFFSNPNIDTLGILLLIVTILTAGLNYLLRTDFGVAMRATGSSESMIRALGVNTNRMKIIGLALANALTAFSGYLITQFQVFADINMGIGVVIVGLGSVIIADTVSNKLQLTAVSLILLMVLAGAVLFQLALAVTLSLGINAYLLKLVTAVFVLLIVSIPRLNFKRSL